jgi:hypothetical protein
MRMPSPRARLGHLLLGAALLAGCGTTANFETAKNLAPGELQAYGHAERLGFLRDSSEVLTGQVRSFGVKVGYGLSRHFNLIAGYDDARMGPNPRWTPVGQEEWKPSRRDRILSLHFKAGSDGRTHAASFGFQRFVDSRLTGLVMASYANWYFSEDLYLGFSPYFYVVNSDENGYSGFALAANATLTLELPAGFFLRPEAGLALPISTGLNGNLGLAAGFGF